jgi:hypothetical protein
MKKDLLEFVISRLVPGKLKFNFGVGYFQNGLKPFSCYVKINYVTKVIEWRLIFT